MRVYAIDKNCHPADVQLPEMASQFLAWLANDANPLLNAIIQRWLWQPANVGGWGALAESAWDIALLRAEITTEWQRPQPATRSDDPACP